MSTIQPPRLAVALLRRFVPDNDPLAGDLIEELQGGRSRLWFWMQVLGAAMMAICRYRPDRHPLSLGLSDDGGLEAAPRARATAINLTGNPAPEVGVGGLGLIALLSIAVAMRPLALMMLAFALMGGVALGVAMILARHAGASSSSKAILLARNGRG
jgi:hypothetical protein